MTDEPPARLILEFDVDADPITGTVRDGSGPGPGEPFSGWMALTHTIEAALESARCQQNLRPIPTTTQL